jgi:hypothetical protein
MSTCTTNDQKALAGVFSKYTYWKLTISPSIVISLLAEGLALVLGLNQKTFCDRNEFRSVVSYCLLWSFLQAQTNTPAYRTSEFIFGPSPYHKTFVAAINSVTWKESWHVAKS